MAEGDRIFLMRPSVGEEELALVAEVLASKWVTDGPSVKEFESALAGFVGAKHAVSATSGTTALELCLRAIGVGPGNEVIVPDFTHPATALCAVAVGATPVLVDVDPRSYNTTADLLAPAITEKTKAVIPVSIFGNPLEIDAINELCRPRGIAVIDDAACSLGSEFGGKHVGSMTDMTVFSFHPRKLFTMGEGGAITTDNDAWAAEMESVKRFGAKSIDGKARFAQYGTNYRLSGILAAVGLGQMRKVANIVDDRREKAALYTQLLADLRSVSPPAVNASAKHNYQTYVVYIDVEGGRDRALKELRSQGIEVQIGTYALHLEPYFAEMRRVGDLSNSEALYHNLLALPLHHELTQDDQKRVVTALRESLAAGTSA